MHPATTFAMPLRAQSQRLSNLHMEKLARHAILQVGVVAAFELLSIEVQDLLTPGRSQREVEDGLTSFNCCLHAGHYSLRDW